MPTYLVTGANRGLGLQFARQLSARGEEVLATARRPAEAAALGDLGVEVFPLDVAEATSVAALARGLGGRPIDVLINNAGVGVGHAPLGGLDYDELRRAFEVNALGPLRVTEGLLDNLRRGGRRLVANVTSKMGSISDNGSGGSYAYRASKSALNMLTRSLSIDLRAEAFTCVLLHPGWVRTDMGGASAPLEASQSVAGMLAVLDSLTPARSGEFLDYSGERVPW
jgi:NAD(P)-dependent dehydrogenase (short-subunit alcohol dehydrogenase family)